MTALRILLSGLFVVAVAAGLLLMVFNETRHAGGGVRTAGGTFAARPAVWFGLAAALFAAIVLLTILFPVIEVGAVGE